MTAFKGKPSAAPMKPLPPPVRLVNCCGACAYFRDNPETANTRDGICHRHPKAMPTYVVHWCGEYKEKP